MSEHRSEIGGNLSLFWIIDHVQNSFIQTLYELKLIFSSGSGQNAFQRTDINRLVSLREEHK